MHGLRKGGMMMKQNEMNKLTMAMLSMFVVFAFCVPSTFAHSDSTTSDSDSFLGYTDSAEVEVEEDSEWPTERQPETIEHEGSLHVVMPDVYEDDESDSEWPTERQPVTTN